MVCTRCPQGGAGVPPRSRVDSGTLTCSLTFSIFQNIAVCLCPIKWTDRLYYLVLPKLTGKTNKWLKNIPANKLWTDNNTDNVSTSKQQGNVRTNTSPTPTTSSSLQGKDNASLIRSERTWQRNK